jgi:flagellar basal body P-ring protein FlgI
MRGGRGKRQKEAKVTAKSVGVRRKCHVGVEIHKGINGEGDKNNKKKQQKAQARLARSGKCLKKLTFYTLTKVVDGDMVFVPLPPFLRLSLLLSAI